MVASDAASSESADNESTVGWRQYLALGLFAVAVGVATSIGVWLFSNGINWINRLTLGVFGSAPQPYGTLARVMIPGLGGIVVALILHRFTHPAKLTGMARIIEGVGEQGGKLDLRNGITFIVASMVSIGVGAPVGADAPSAMIGGHLAEWLAKRVKLPTLFIRSLVVAGVGAGISATYFAQLSAVFFALEVVAGGFGGVFFIAPTMIAVAMSAVVTYLLGGAPTQYDMHISSNDPQWVLLLYIGVAVLGAILAVLYVNLLPLMMAFWRRVSLPFWAKPAVAGVVVGVVGLWNPYVLGAGLDHMKIIFSGAAVPITTLLLLMAAKLMLTPWSLGAGFAGGVIGPSLLVGSALGAAYGHLVNMAFPGLDVSPTAFAMVATAAMLAGTFHAPLFAAMLMFQMSEQYVMLLPLLIAAAIGYALANRFQRGSAYTYMFPDLGIQLKPGLYTMTRPDRPVQRAETTP